MRQTAGSVCPAGGEWNTSASFKPQWKSRNNSGGETSWNAVRRSVNGGARNAILMEIQSPVFANAIDMNQPAGTTRRLSYGPSAPIGITLTPSSRV